MRTYDPADRIHYVHLAQDRAPAAAPERARHECDRLPAGYANASLRQALRTEGARPALVVLAGGSAAADRPTAAPPALRLAH